MASELSEVRQLEILSQIAQLAENGPAYQDDLIGQGFSAFLPCQTKSASFCENEEATIHARYDIEVAKIYIGTPSGIPGHIRRQSPTAYRSDFIEKLRLQRDETNGMSYQDIAVSQHWRRELDPCMRRERQLFPYPARDRPTWLIDMLEARRRLRESEAEVHSSHLGDHFDDTPAGWEQFWLELLLVYVGPMGFTLDPKRSSPFLPVYSKQITPYWGLCFSLASAEDIKLQMKFGHDKSDLHTQLRIELSVRAPGRKAGNLIATEVWSGRMPIRYMRLVNAFEWAYGSFTNFDDWEAALKAYVCLYRLVSKPIEDILALELN
jgi:hypothetical protein